MDESQLKAFVAINKHGSFTAAANSLHLTQPAISKRIAALEIQLGSPLFDRIGRNIRLTDTGDKLLLLAENLLISFNNLRKTADNMKQQVSGSLSLGTSHHIGLHRLPPVLRQYTNQYPDVELALHFVDSEDGVQGVESGLLEMAIITLPANTPKSLSATQVWDDPLALVVGKMHKLAGKDTVDVKELARYEAILPNVNTYTRVLLEEKLALTGYKLHIGLSTNFLETNKMMASIGLGWTIIPETMLDETVVKIGIKNIDLRRKLGYVTHNDMTLSNATKAMIGLLNSI
ncbi:MAG: LysR family transcriptional regulator [Gammaproteobacteria bacterium]|nr:MAG: LysR family transcriptional regulator [Gammaproteobacteria bacterium]